MSQEISDTLARNYGNMGPMILNVAQQIYDQRARHDTPMWAVVQDSERWPYLLAAARWLDEHVTVIRVF
jgi:hypothetical protein